MTTTTVSSKGAVVIPKELRKKYGIEPGGKIQLFDINGSLQLRILPKDPIEYACGLLKESSKSVLEMLQEGRIADQKHEQFLEERFGKTEKNLHE